jgi:hypothetical protein
MRRLPRMRDVSLANVSNERRTRLIVVLLCVLGAVAATWASEIGDAGVSAAENPF